MITNSKPHSEIFLKATEELNVESLSCLVLEDSEVGVEATYQANILVICVPDIKHPDQEAIEKAGEVYDCIIELINYLENNY